MLSTGNVDTKSQAFGRAASRFLTGHALGGSNRGQAALSGDAARTTIGAVAKTTVFVVRWGMKCKRKNDEYVPTSPCLFKPRFRCAGMYKQQQRPQRHQRQAEPLRLT